MDVKCAQFEGKSFSEKQIFVFHFRGWRLSFPPPLKNEMKNLSWLRTAAFVNFRDSIKEEEEAAVRLKM